MDPWASPLVGSAKRAIQDRIVMAAAKVVFLHRLSIVFSLSALFGFAEQVAPFSRREVLAAGSRIQQTARSMPI
jgi:hypothetical protein